MSCLLTSTICLLYIRFRLVCEENVLQSLNGFALDNNVCALVQDAYVTSAAAASTTTDRSSDLQIPFMHCKR